MKYTQLSIAVKFIFFEPLRWLKVLSLIKKKSNDFIKQ